jgi:hypothetical protein
LFQGQKRKRQEQTQGLNREAACYIKKYLLGSKVAIITVDRGDSGAVSEQCRACEHQNFLLDIHQPQRNTRAEITILKNEKLEKEWGQYVNGIQRQISRCLRHDLTNTEEVNRNGKSTTWQSMPDAGEKLRRDRQHENSMRLSFQSSRLQSDRNRGLFEELFILNNSISKFVAIFVLAAH